MPAVMLALGATLVATGPNGSRTINADDFFTGLFQTALAENEILTEVRVPAMKHGAYVKHPHPASRYAVVGVAVAGTEKDSKADMVRIGITGASSHAYRPMMAEMMINGKSLETTTITEAAKHAADGVTMNSDLVASAHYRAQLATVYTKRALMSLHTRMM
jgi:carbon-monoxide dehydrogenase medium subunit